jgi:hypothetical protein
MNLQVIASPDGDIVWGVGALPGSVHDKKAEWIWGVLGELEKAGLITLADKGLPGQHLGEDPLSREEQAGTAEKANRAHATLRAPGERANVQLKIWRILRKLRCCPAAAPGVPVSLPGQSTYCSSVRHNQVGMGSLATLCHLWRQSLRER